MYWHCLLHSMLPGCDLDSMLTAIMKDGEHFDMSRVLYFDVGACDINAMPRCKNMVEVGQSLGVCYRSKVRVGY